MNKSKNKKKGKGKGRERERTGVLGGGKGNEAKETRTRRIRGEWGVSRMVCMVRYGLDDT